MTTHPSPGSQAGFSLMEMSMVLAIMGVMTTAFASGSVGFVENKRIDSAKLKLDAIEAAIVRYAAAAKRMPCPADATTNTAANVGVEDRTNAGECQNNQNDGIVPWVTLGLPREAALDPWGRFITMRVAPGTTTTTAFGNLSNLGTFVANKGLRVSETIDDENWRVIMNPASTPSTGAAYVLISHGKDGLGAIGGGDATGYQARNANDTNLLDPATATNTYIIGPTRDDFDDVVRAAPLSQIIVKAGLLYGS